MQDDDRPDPDRLLAEVQHDESQSRRGRLRIYFGASAGVGKTFAMLSAARTLREQGRDVAVGIVETHGRADTAALLQGLEILPLREVTVGERRQAEFDLDAALARAPDLLLVDELAHTNAPGSRHPKRWQDVDELLDAGIDVFSTLNVQHLLSLNDAVGGITGIAVRETVPDTFFDRADEVILVDVPPDELLGRLHAGKVYVPEQAERAARNFFRKGNLIALRELSLRRTADRVEGDVQSYRRRKSIDGVWNTAASLLCCIGPGPEAEPVVRGAARLATQLNVEWSAVYVETPRLQSLPAAERERILRSVKLAQDLGARTAVLHGTDVASAIVTYARTHNVAKVVHGTPAPTRFAPYRRSLPGRLAHLATELDLVQIGSARPEAEPPAPTAPAATEPGRSTLPAYAWAAAACVIPVAIGSALLPYFDLVNIAMLFLLTVVLIAMAFGRGPAAFAACLGVAAFDFFFVPPRFSFAVSDVQYLLTFAVMLAVGLITGQLTASLRWQARVATAREDRARALYEFARDLSSPLRNEDVAVTTAAFLGRTFQADVTLLTPDEHQRLRCDPETPGAEPVDPATAQWAFDHRQAAGLGTDTLPGSGYLYLPLNAPMRTRGILAVKPRRAGLLMLPEQRRQLDTYAALIAIALERVHYVEVAQAAMVRIESERLRNSLLSALSHDLRTPLAALYGLADTLRLSSPALSAEQIDLADAIRDSAATMGSLVNNLLDMARIESGQVRLDRQWQSIEEVVGSVLRTLGRALQDHPVSADLPADLPLVEFDAMLIERVLSNLLENAAKYTPEASPIRIVASARGEELWVAVEDRGPGIPAGQAERIFEKFHRGVRESATAGVGLGLAICRAIVEAHHGRIWAENDPAGGARFCFTLPLGTPPAPPASGANGTADTAAILTE